MKDDEWWKRNKDECWDYTEEEEDDSIKYFQKWTELEKYRNQ